MSGLVPVIVLLLPFCSSEESKDACTPGREVACACPGGGSGSQVCTSDGSGFEPCRCVDGGAGAAGAAGSSAIPDSGSGATGGTTTLDAQSECPQNTATDAPRGDCDVVKQDCPTGQTCTLQESAGAWKSNCVTLGNGPKKLSEACSFHQDCAAGLRCTLGKCTRPCCPTLAAEICGPSGKCDLQITFGMAPNTAKLLVCTFSPPCTPWASDCPPGAESDCHVFAGGVFECSFPNYSADAGPTLGKPCVYLNDCGDSQICIYPNADAATGTCRWLCKAKDEGAPDAGTVNGPPGKGGCEVGQTCLPYSNPSWLGFCNP